MVEYLSSKQGMRVRFPYPTPNQASVAEWHTRRTQTPCPSGREGSTPFARTNGAWRNWHDAFVENWHIKLS